MYLSRIEINSRLQATKKALSSPQIIHATVKACFPSGSKNVLWRIDRLQHTTYLLISSHEAPDFRHVIEQFGWPTAKQKGEVHLYDNFLDKLADGQKWRFRLSANPTRTDPKTKKVYAHVSLAQQKDWLLKRASKNGFALQANEFDIFNRSHLKFRHRSEFITLSVCEFEGWLKITDVKLFRQLLVTGLGRAKAYGYGLLTIMKR
jgi:CRISPR system Cascade subunit CasE